MVTLSRYAVIGGEHVVWYRREGQPYQLSAAWTHWTTSSTRVDYLHTIPDRHERELRAVHPVVVGGLSEMQGPRAQRLHIALDPDGLPTPSSRWTLQVSRFE